MKGKRYVTTKKKKGKLKYPIKIILLTLIIFLLIVLSILFIKRNDIFNKDLDSNTDTNSSNIVEQTIEVQTVENADYLEITDLDVVSKDGYSTVSTTIKNTSNETVTNFRLDICIYDKDNNLVSQLTNPIVSLAPNETIDSFGIVYTELLDDYTCIIKKN